MSSHGSRVPGAKRPTVNVLLIWCLFSLNVVVGTAIGAAAASLIPEYIESADLAERDPPSGATDLTVDLEYEVYKGVYDQTTQLNTWKGIRYAAAPTGSLRWQAPRTPLTDRNSVKSAGDFGPICPQNYPSVPNAPVIPGNEDCLFLNVYSPARKVTKPLLPVLIWIHGGGYGFGDGTQEMTEIINDNGNSFVAVTIQYRLGAFGFLSSNEVHDRGVTNAGLLDQAFALQWVQKNIKLFGGDPTKVTISGESAGAGSVMLHNLAFNGAPTTLFTNVGYSNAETGFSEQDSIAASPFLPPQYSFDDATPELRYREFADAVGCSQSTQSIFDCLISMDSPTLQAASAKVSSSQIYGTWAFLPVVDGKYVQQFPSQQLFQKQVAGKRILVGNNANEGPLFVPANITTENDLIGFLKLSFPRFSDSDINAILKTYPSGSGPVIASDAKYATNGLGPDTAINISQVATGQQQRANNIYAESTFDCPSYLINQAFASPKHESYKYQYSVPFAAHTDDVPAYFGPATPNQSRDFQLAFRHIWGNFITCNNPSISPALGNGSAAPNTNAGPGTSASGSPCKLPEPQPPNTPSGAIPKSAPFQGSFPQFSPQLPTMLNLNTTGGTPYTTVTQFGVPVTQFQQPGLNNAFTLVDANAWEGGRGQRCEFWRAMAAKVPN